MRSQQIHDIKLALMIQIGRSDNTLYGKLLKFCLWWDPALYWKHNSCTKAKTTILCFLSSPPVWLTSSQGIWIHCQSAPACGWASKTLPLPTVAMRYLTWKLPKKSNNFNLIFKNFRFLIYNSISILYAESCIVNLMSIKMWI